jgi:hypothetical protein
VRAVQLDVAADVVDVSAALPDVVDVSTVLPDEVEVSGALDDVVDVGVGDGSLDDEPGSLDVGGQDGSGLGAVSEPGGVVSVGQVGGVDGVDGRVPPEGMPGAVGVDDGGVPGPVGGFGCDVWLGCCFGLCNAPRPSGRPGSTGGGNGGSAPEPGGFGTDGSSGMSTPGTPLA